MVVGRGLGAGRGVGAGRGAGRGFGAGRGRGYGGPAKCKCPKCGYEVEHQAGVPCMSLKCPKCGTTMIRGDL